MLKKQLFLAAGTVAIVIVAALAAFLWSYQSRAADANGARWEAVSAQVLAGQNVRLTLRLVDANSNVIAAPITVTSTRLDMGPDNMAAMMAPLRPVPNTEPGTLAFDTDLTMAGRWALTISARVEGYAEPITGMVVFTATEQRTDATPAASAAGEREILYYRNPMGLPDVSPVPKKDTMGMDYIPVYADEMSGPPGTVTISTERIQRAGVRTETVQRRDIVRTIRAAGTIVPDESRLATSTVKFEGFVEELFVPTTGASVRAGQPLLRVWIESKEILDRQVDYALALRGTGNLADAERNLRIFDIPEQVFEQIRETGRPVRSITLTAPLSGIVLEKPAVVGMRFGAGEVLYRTADLSTLWIMADVSERDLGLVRAGQTASIGLAAFPGEEFEGRVDFVYPELDMATRTAKVRIVVPNQDMRLKVGQYADVVIEAPIAGNPVLAVPDSAVIDSGSRQVVFVAREGGVFEPRDVTLGYRGEGFVEIRDGLNEGERIVTAGNFLIDAESNLRAALMAFTAAGTPQ
jgi:Cu(I)/Ag(I) efflux system membrane fusion protein